MKAVNSILSLVVSVFVSVAAAEIRQVGTMKEALADIVQGDVVVFDIDNTILEPVQTLGSDQWVDYLVEKNKHAGLDAKQALEKALIDWRLVQRATEVRLVEPNTAQQIRKLQMNGITVLALTARPQDLDQVTVDQLSRLGVHFEHHNGFIGNDVGYLEGVLFANGKNKGLVLRDFLNQLKLSPHRLIFIDDKEKNVKNMDAEFAKDSFANINFRYAAADERVKSFSSAIAELEWNYFAYEGILISDKLASELIVDDQRPAVGL